MSWLEVAFVLFIGKRAGAKNHKSQVDCEKKINIYAGLYILIYSFAMDGSTKWNGRRTRAHDQMLLMQTTKEITHRTPEKLFLWELTPLSTYITVGFL